MDLASKLLQNYLKDTDRVYYFDKFESCKEDIRLRIGEDSVDTIINIVQDLDEKAHDIIYDFKELYIYIILDESSNIVGLLLRSKSFDEELEGEIEICKLHAKYYVWSYLDEDDKYLVKLNNFEKYKYEEDKEYDKPFGWMIGQEQLGITFDNMNTSYFLYMKVEFEKRSDNNYFSSILFLSRDLEEQSNE